MTEKGKDFPGWESEGNVLSCPDDGWFTTMSGDLIASIVAEKHGQLRRAYYKELRLREGGEAYIAELEHERNVQRDRADSLSADLYRVMKERDALAAQFGEPEPEPESVDVPSDERLGTIAADACQQEATRYSYIDSRKVNIAVARAVREAVEAPYKVRIAALEGELEHAKACREQSRPCKVEFDVTPGTAWDELARICGAITGDYHDAEEIDNPTEDEIADLMSYLASHARVVVPEGVPTPEEIHAEWKRGNNSIYQNKIIEWVRDYLAPWLGQAVDVELCEKRLILECAKFNDDELQLVTAETCCCLAAREQGTTGRINLSPADAHHAGMWLLSFAAANGIDVRLPVKPEGTDYQVQANIKLSAELEDVRAERDDWKAAFEKSRDASEPPADPVTLEKLAEIGWRAWIGGQPAVDWSEKSKETYDDWRNAVTAILAAAKPYVHCHPVEIRDAWDSPSLHDTEKWNACYHLCNSRIRYRVSDLPDPDEISDIRGPYKGYYDLRQRQRECYDAVYVAHLARNYSEETSHKTALRSARTLPKREAELDAALDGKDEG